MVTLYRVFFRQQLPYLHSFIRRKWQQTATEIDGNKS